ncbi:MAG: type VI secretion system Vgr family protein [Methylococcales bacterium]
MSTQDTRFASVTTPLGSEVLLFSRMNGYEALSRLFEYEIDLLVDEANKSIVTGGFPTNAVLGQPMTITLTLPAGGKRYFHGLVTQFKHHGVVEDFYQFRAVIRPWLWFLTRTSNCRIFQEQTVPDIIKKVFAENGFSDYKLELTQSYQPREYCVQYRESDFNFVSRLMEWEGIFYYFKHEASKHTLIIGDSINAYQTIGGYETIPYFPPENTGRRNRDHIAEWQTAHQVQSGKYVLNDYDFEKPKSNLITKFTEIKPHSLADGEQYDYPGNYYEPPLGESYSNIRLDELQSDYQVMQGSGDAMGLTTGMLFTLKDHYISPENTKHILIAANYTIVNNQYRATATERTHFECDFKAIRSTQQFRAGRLTPVPFVQGPQTATVVGKAGEEIWTDKYGRVKVQFHWDRYGKHNENSSCWIRVATPIAGKNWGWVSLPRIDQEVVVSFLEGNPDRPLITGSVYNANQMPPYALPANQTQSGFKSRSSKGGTPANFNEIRFEDKKGQEQVYIHAEKNQDNVVENNETTSVGNNRTETVGHDETITIGNNRTETVGNNENITIKGFKTETVIMALAETVGLGKAETIGLAKALSIGVDYVVTVGKDIIVNAGDSISLTVGKSSLVMKKDGTIILNGKTIDVVGDSHIQLDSKRIDLN